MEKRAFMNIQGKWGIFTIIAAIVILIPLWQQKEVVCSVYLALFIAWALVCLRGQLNEQRLRHERIIYEVETPLANQLPPPAASPFDIQPEVPITYYPQE